MAGAMLSTSNFSRYWPIKGHACCRIYKTEHSLLFLSWQTFSNVVVRAIVYSFLYLIVLAKVNDVMSLEKFNIQ